MGVKILQCMISSKVSCFLKVGMSTGKLGDEYDKDMSFKLNVSQFRRKKLLESMMSENKQQEEKGTKILQNFKKQIVNNPQLKESLN